MDRKYCAVVVTTNEACFDDLVDKAIRMNPKDPAAHLWLAQGLVLMRIEGDDAGNKKLKDEACQEYRTVLKMEPRNKDAQKGMELIGCPGAAG